MFAAFDWSGVWPSLHYCDWVRVWHACPHPVPSGPRPVRQRADTREPTSRRDVVFMILSTWCIIRLQHCPPFRSINWLSSSISLFKHQYSFSRPLPPDGSLLIITQMRVHADKTLLPCSWRCRGASRTRPVSSISFLGVDSGLIGHGWFMNAFLSKKYFVWIFHFIIIR